MPLHVRVLHTDAKRRNTPETTKKERSSGRRASKQGDMSAVNTFSLSSSETGCWQCNRRARVSDCAFGSSYGVICIWFTIRRRTMKLWMACLRGSMLLSCLVSALSIFVSLSLHLSPSLVTTDDAFYNEPACCIGPVVLLALLPTTS